MFHYVCPIGIWISSRFLCVREWQNLILWFGPSPQGPSSNRIITFRYLRISFFFSWMKHLRSLTGSNRYACHHRWQTRKRMSIESPLLVDGALREVWRNLRLSTPLTSFDLLHNDTFLLVNILLSSDEWYVSTRKLRNCVILVLTCWIVNTSQTIMVYIRIAACCTALIFSCISEIFFSSLLIEKSIHKK